MAFDTVIVDLPGRGYPIEIGSGLLVQLGARLRDRLGTRRATVMSDQTVCRLYGDAVGRSLETAGIEYAMMTVPPGDASKSIEIAAELYDELAEGRHARDEPVIALGGGMVGDLAGFIAATWMRGVPLVQCPTTLEAMIDASIGGKTALNHPAGKNLIGAFHQPILVCTDTDCLASLPDRDFRAGLAESVKHAVIADEAFFRWHEVYVGDITARTPGVIQELIRRNCEIKAAVVIADERETSATSVGRAALNFGHTIGHAIEAESAYQLRHGEAVALGMVAEMELAVRRTAFGDEARRRVEALLLEIGLPVRSIPPLDCNATAKRLLIDKKTVGQGVRFVLPSQIGQTQWEMSASLPDILAAMQVLDGK